MWLRPARFSGCRTLRSAVRQFRHELKATIVFGPTYATNRFVRPYPPRGFTPRQTQGPGELEVHMLTSDRDHCMALWSALSYYLTSGRNDSLIVHDDGTFGEHAIEAMRRYFVEVRIIRRKEADDVVTERFRRFPLLLKLRRRLPHILKLTDFYAFCDAARFVMLDSDVLFFSSPRELCCAGSGHWFSEDIFTAYAVDLEALRSRTKVDLPPRVNCGMANVAKGLVDFEAMEWLLGRGLIDLDSCLPNVEQTLWAVECRRSGFQFLPNSYGIARGPGRNGLIAKHYVGGVVDRFRTARDYFFTEGIPAVRAMLNAGKVGIHS